MAQLFSNISNRTLLAAIIATVVLIGLALALSKGIGTIFSRASDVNEEIRQNLY